MVKLKKYTIIVPKGLSELDVMNTVKNIINSESEKDNDIDEMTISLYYDESDIESSDIVCKAIWGVNGKLGRITPRIAKNNDKSKHTITFVNNTPITKTPSLTDSELFSCNGSNNSQLTTEARTKAINSIMQASEVVDAAISQQGDRLSLAVIVRRTTSESRAKEIGENFVRLVKTFSDDPAPSREIGSGSYDYVIGVYYPNEDTIVKGAKASNADRINW